MITLVAVATLLLGAMPAIGTTTTLLAEGKPACEPDPLSVAAQRAGLVDFTEDPEAGTWTTWYTDVDALMPPPPPAAASEEGIAEILELKALQLNRTDAAVQQAQSYDVDAASSYWSDLMLHLVVAHSAKDGSKNPPRLSRQFAMLETAMHDALVVTWAAKYCYQRLPPGALDPTLSPVLKERASPSYPSEHAAVAGVIQVMFPVFYPPAEEPLGFDGIVTNVTESRILGGANYRSDVEAGLAIGRAVASQVLAARANDGSSDKTPVVVPTGPCLWKPTPPGFRAQPVEPHWGDVTPFAMASGSQFRPPPPPECNGVDWNAQARDIYEVSKTLTDRQKRIADYWAGGQGTETPPGMWLHVALNSTYSHGSSTMQTARILSHVAVALADAAIACWDAKFTYWGERPVTTIRATIDPTWSSYITTPPFPGYVSGHSTFAGAFSTTLTYFFPEDAVTYSALASEAAASRYYGGIHIRADNEIGLVLGTNVASVVIAHAELDA